MRMRSIHQHRNIHFVQIKFVKRAGLFMQIITASEVQFYIQRQAEMIVRMRPH